MKPVVFIGSSFDDLRAFPERARRGTGVREIRVRESSGAFRVVYVATFIEAVYVLHAFAKKTQRTAPRDLALAQSRFRDLKRGATR
jgi:phage-related protein